MRNNPHLISQSTIISHLKILEQYVEMFNKELEASEKEKERKRWWLMRWIIGKMKNHIISLSFLLFHLIYHHHLSSTTTIISLTKGAF